MQKKHSNLDYAFAVGKIRALEKFLIRQEVFEEAIATDLKEAVRLFVESDLYGDELLGVKTSQQLETVLDKALLELKKQISELILDKELRELLDLDTKKCVAYLFKKYRNPFLEDYFRHLIDMHNIKTFLRLHILGEQQSALEENLICDGFIKRETYLKLYQQELAVFINQLGCVHKGAELIDYAFFLREGIQKLQTQRSFVALEKAMHDFLIRILRPAKFIVFGPEPVLAYYFAKVNEINLIRLVILAKLNNISADLIKERLNYVYA